LNFVCWWSNFPCQLHCWALLHFFQFLIWDISQETYNTYFNNSAQSFRNTGYKDDGVNVTKCIYFNWYWTFSACFTLVCYELKINIMEDVPLMITILQLVWQIHKIPLPYIPVCFRIPSSMSWSSSNSTGTRPRRWPMSLDTNPSDKPSDIWNVS
jgi:hypothetical protein